METIDFEFVKVPKSLIKNIEKTYQEIKENITKEIIREIKKEYGISIRD